MNFFRFQYAPDEFIVEGPSNNDGRYGNNKAVGGLYGADSFYDTSSGSWYPTAAAGSNYGSQPSPSLSYHNVGPVSQNHEHYGMGINTQVDPHLHNPQPLPPMSSFRGSSNPGQSSNIVHPGPANPALFNQPLQQHNLQSDTLVGKALQTVSILNQRTIETYLLNALCTHHGFYC